MSFLFIIFILLNVIVEEKTLCSINIGGIFEGPDQESEIAFRVAVDIANNLYGFPNKTLTPLITYIEPEAVTDKHRALIGITWDRPLVALETACSLSRAGVVGIVGPLSTDNANTVQSVCDAKEIPFIRTTGDRYHEQDDCCSTNVFPSIQVLSRAFADLVERWDWKSFTIMYESDYSLANIAELLKLYDVKGHLVVLEQLRKSEYGDYRDDLKKIRKSKQTNFVLHCENENLNEILEQAQQVGLMMRRYSYIIMNLELHTIDLSLYKDSETNITTLVNPSKLEVIKVAEAMQGKRKELGLQTQDMEPSETAWKVKLSTALIIDAVLLFAETLKDVGDFEVNSLLCNASDSWEHGSTLYNFMKMKTIDGLTGPVQFDYLGVRSNFVLDIAELTEQGLTKIGTWNSQEGLSISRKDPQVESSEGDSMRNISINVMIAWSDPYALYKNESVLLKGNDQYEGFVIDLIQEISLIEGFKYTLLRNPDDKNGDYDPATKTWNGMIGDILSGTGDIAIGDLTITRQRKEFVDFTTPFMASGIQILFKKPSKATPAFFAFADPFKPMVWFLIGISYFAVSLGLYIMSRFCPAEWENWDPCVQDPKYNFNQFGARNSLWYMLGCLMQEGADIAPRGASTRILSSVWAFFILVIVSYYKAQLAASLTVESYELPFKSAEELTNKAYQLGIRYGAVANEAVHTYFQQSPVKLHQKIAAYMDTHPELMVEDNYGGFLLIEEGNYAFFTESVFAKFVTTAVCYVTAIGEPMNEQNFAIAMRKGYPYRAALSKAILQLLESGKVAELQKRWWEEEKFRMPECEESESSSIAPPLNYHHVAGMFWITFGGIFAACVLVFVELAIFVFYKCGRDYKEFLKDYKKELRFYFSFKEGPKPVRNGRIATSDVGTQNQVDETSS